MLGDLRRSDGRTTDPVTEAPDPPDPPGPPPSRKDRAGKPRSMSIPVPAREGEGEREGAKHLNLRSRPVASSRASRGHSGRRWPARSAVLAPRRRATSAWGPAGHDAGAVAPPRRTTAPRPSRAAKRRGREESGDKREREPPPRVKRERERQMWKCERELGLELVYIRHRRKQHHRRWPNPTVGIRFTTVATVRAEIGQTFSCL